MFVRAQVASPSVQEIKEEDYYCCERWWGGFERSFTLPAGVDAQRTSATFKNGVLEVHLPKAEKARRAAPGP